ncbi:TIGR02453 family protein [Anianabacter salinae]|uniref:TIGR02453 family protein n=1 Tax=Anianabacter salinae TaxID=2851023 RepID=UPI00225DE542|nr:TIGR02453 family protein [Anianabacter salinae]MBV0912545.1 TIGR02453 family protein [Anianabacter salinae]
MPAELLVNARSFLSRLNETNTREWFLANKAEYESNLRAPAQRLLDRVAEDLERLTRTPIVTKIFRPNRDVRFSKDKSPYTTHLHMLWRQSTRDDGPGWFYGIAPDYAKAGFGWMEFSKDQLSAWRMAIDGPFGPGVDAAIRSTGLSLPEPDLKRVPQGHEPDHPQADLLRRKGLVLWQDDVDSDPEALIEVFQKVDPVRQQLEGLL